MHLQSTYLVFALSMASNTLARPRATAANNYVLPTITNPYSSGETGLTNIPAQCHMFKPYVPQALLGAVCSLHMTPLAAGVVPTLNSACFGAAQPTHVNTYVNTYEAGDDGTTTLRGGGGYTVQRPTSTLGGYEGQWTTTTRQGGGGGYTVQATPTNTFGYN